jgi:hypothetical protein
MQCRRPARIGHEPAVFFEVFKYEPAYRVFSRRATVSLLFFANSRRSRIVVNNA